MMLQNGASLFRMHLSGGKGGKRETHLGEVGASELGEGMLGVAVPGQHHLLDLGDRLDALAGKVGLHVVAKPLLLQCLHPLPLQGLRSSPLTEFFFKRYGALGGCRAPNDRALHPQELLS